MNRRTVRTLATAMMLGLVAQPLLASNLRWLNYSPVRFFTDHDWAIATAAGRQALNETKDGETVSWENPKSGNFGSLTPLGTATKNGETCRQLRIVNNAKGMMGSSVYEFCQKQDGKWGAVEGGPVAARGTGVAGQGQGQSIMFGQQQGGDYSHLITAPAGQSTSLGDKCQAMAREIDQLKGKPQRRSTLMERYQAECQRP